jgi:hypothetical protein
VRRGEGEWERKNERPGHEERKLDQQARDRFIASSSSRFSFSPLAPPLSSSSSDLLSNQARSDAHSLISTPLFASDKPILYATATDATGKSRERNDSAYKKGIKQQSREQRLAGKARRASMSPSSSRCRSWPPFLFCLSLYARTFVSSSDAASGGVESRRDHGGASFWSQVVSSF